ncbi:MAG TPA: M23 family metallopeptidase [Thermoanaerobaculia bacterium]|nr:M23 family metallopeptidase [Thermoanaerobaculia bacterium]
MKKLLFVALFAVSSVVHAAGITITTLPATPLIEPTKHGQALNFDLLIDNGTSAPIELTEVVMSVLDAKGNVVHQRRLWSNGDSISTIPNRKAEAGEKLVVFNPFPELDPELALSRLRYDLTFDDATVASVTVAPKVYKTKTNLTLPLHARVLVHDGHDFYSHHRRLDITGGMTTALGITSNPFRYAYDFIVVDEKGEMVHGSGEKNEDYLSFGTPVLTTGDGVVVAAENGRADNTKTVRVPMSKEEFLKNPMISSGNYVILDHGNGEFSLFAHMKHGTVTVKAGDRVKQGQTLGVIGWSGDAIFPHLHYQLQSSAGFTEGLPSAFRDVKRLVGASWAPVPSGHVDTGDVVRSTRPAR